MSPHAPGCPPNPLPHSPPPPPAPSPPSLSQRFVGSLRKFGYDGDIVLAVSPPEKMKPGVADYAKKTKVVAYGFEVDCAGTDNCKLKGAPRW